MEEHYRFPLGFAQLQSASDPDSSCSVQGGCSVRGGWRSGDGGGFGERSWGHIRAVFTTAEWCIPLYTRAGQPSGLTDLKTTVYSSVTVT